jgi:uncharacterized damage-inducible protein DinB
MIPSDPTQVLLKHDRWATRQILDACAALSHEQFHRRFEMGPGSLHDTLTHMLSAMRLWGDLLAGRPFHARLDQDGAQRSVADLIALWDEITTDFATAAAGHPLADLVTRERNGKSYTFPRGGVITHVTTHDMHHRAQCLNMLRHVGVSPLPPSSIVEWMMAGGPA